MSPDRAPQTPGAPRAPRAPPRPGDAVDQRRIRIALTALAATAAGGLWAVLGIEWAERWCRAVGCTAEDTAALGLAVAWAATAAVVAGRMAWTWDFPRRLTGLALLVWTAACVTFPAATGVVLAGPLLEALLGFSFGFGFLAHWSLIAAVHLVLLFGMEQWLRGRIARGQPDQGGGRD